MASWAGSQYRKAPSGKWPESWFPGRPELAVFSVHFRKGSKPTSVGWLYPFKGLKKYIIVGVKYFGEKATSAFTVSICPLQDSQLYPAAARAGCKLDSHPCPWWAANAAIPFSRDIRWHANKIFIVLFGCWDKCLVLSHFPFDKDDNVKAWNNIPFESRVCHVLSFPCWLEEYPIRLYCFDHPFILILLESEDCFPISCKSK